MYTCVLQGPPLPGILSTKKKNRRKDSTAESSRRSPRVKPWVTGLAGKTPWSIDCPACPTKNMLSAAGTGQLRRTATPEHLLLARRARPSTIDQLAGRCCDIRNFPHGCFIAARAIPSAHGPTDRTQKLPLPHTHTKSSGFPLKKKWHRQKRNLFKY